MIHSSENGNDHTLQFAFPFLRSKLKSYMHSLLLAVVGKTTSFEVLCATLSARSPTHSPDHRRVKEASDIEA